MPETAIVTKPTTESRIQDGSLQISFNNRSGADIPELEMSLLIGEYIRSVWPQETYSDLGFIVCVGDIPTDCDPDQALFVGTRQGKGVLGLPLVFGQIGDWGPRRGALQVYRDGEVDSDLLDELSSACNEKPRGLLKLVRQDGEEIAQSPKLIPPIQQPSRMVELFTENESLRARLQTAESIIMELQTELIKRPAFDEAQLETEVQRRLSQYIDDI